MEPLRSRQGLTVRDDLHITGRILYLTKDEELLRRQLDGEDIDPPAPEDLIDNISTDEITPGWVCYYYDETLGRYSLVGLRGGVITKDAIAKGGFEVIVSGLSKGCGSSRETAPFSEMVAGIKLVIARSIEKIYGQNCHNIGLLTSTDFSLLDRIRAGETIPVGDFTADLDPISAAIVEHGGLFAYNKARQAGDAVAPVPSTPPRPMTAVEKIIAAHAVGGADEPLGVAAVKPGDALFIRADTRFSHEYVTPMAEALFKLGLGDDAVVNDPTSVFAFRDHLTFLEQVMSEEHKSMGLMDQAGKLPIVQADWAQKHDVRVYGEVFRDGAEAGSEGICHNIIMEEVATPGSVVLGTDSHTCMAGVLGSFAFGVGSTDMANSWFTRDVRVKVPATAKVSLTGTLQPGVTAKDVMLELLSYDYFSDGRGIGKVLEFTGPGVVAMPLGERATLANMAVEAGGFTGFVEADEHTLAWIARMRGADAADFESGIVRSDADAEYDTVFEIDLDTLEPLVATPGDPRNGIPLSQLENGDPVAIDIAYGGSCTGGKKEDMDMYAAVLKQAHEQGKRVADGVRLYLQFGSQRIRRYAERQGYIEIFEAVGAELIDPSCGACIRAGPGVSEAAGDVTVSSQNRNFPGRSGPGQVYLASPYVVAASAIAGHVAGPDTVLAGVELAVLEH